MQEENVTLLPFWVLLAGLSIKLTLDGLTGENRILNTHVWGPRKNVRPRGSQMVEAHVSPYHPELGRRDRGLGHQRGRGWDKRVCHALQGQGTRICSPPPLIPRRTPWLSLETALLLDQALHLNCFRGVCVRGTCWVKGFGNTYGP